MKSLLRVVVGLLALLLVVVVGLLVGARFADGPVAIVAGGPFTSGELVRGVRYTGNGAHTETLAMRGKSGTVRRIQSDHNFDKLMRYSALAYDNPADGSGA